MEIQKTEKDIYSIGDIRSVSDIGILNYKTIVIIEKQSRLNGNKPLPWYYWNESTDSELGKEKGVILFV